MNRYGYLRPYPLIHGHELVARRMARDMHKMIALRDDLDPELHQLVLQLADGALVAGNDARGEHHGVALLECNVWVFLPGNAGESRARLALAPGADHQHLLARQIADVVLGD